MALWAAAGYLNTCSYIVAPLVVAPQHKATANGLLAIVYQSAHCFGLVLAVVLEAVLFREV